MPRPGPRPAHTLIEVLVVLAIIGVVLVAVAPALPASRDDPLHRTADEVLALLRRTRATAAQRDVAASFVVDPVTRQWWVTAGDADSVLATATLPLDPAVTLGAASRRVRFVFHARGTAHGDVLVARAGTRRMMLRVERWSGRPHADAF